MNEGGPSKYYRQEERREEPNRTLLIDAMALVGATDMAELSKLYDREDQKLMNSGEWDYEDQNLLINQIKELISSADPDKLSDVEREWRQEILWFWYHHATSCALWKKKDIVKARLYSEDAIKYQSNDHPNRITRVLYLLTHDRLGEAREWSKSIDNTEERDAAAALISSYEEGKFY